MVLEFSQDRSKFGLHYVVKSGSGMLYKVDIPYGEANERQPLYKNNMLIGHVRFSSKDLGNDLKKSSKTSRKLLAFDVRNKENYPIANLFETKSKFFGGYYFFEFTVNGLTYNVYQISLGKEGTHIVIYLGDTQVGLIVKSTVIYDNKGTYKIYLLDNEHMDVVVLFNLYLDFATYGFRREMVSNTKKVTYSYTTNKELKSKYNPEFKRLAE